MRLALFALLLSLATPAAAQDREVSIAGPQGALHGALLAPPGAKAVVVIIPGSGAINRDGDGPVLPRAQSYKLLAEGLAARGIASVRIDKRGLYSSAAAIADPNKVTIGDYAADARAWAAFAAKETGHPCAWLLGHSEGGVVALAAGNAPAICGQLLVSSPGRPMAEVIRAQLRANPANAPLLPDADRALDALAAGKTIDVAGFHPALQQLFNPAVQGLLIDEFRQNPRELAAALKGPVLIVQGQADLQVTPADAAALKGGAPFAELLLVPGVNHVLKHVDGTQGDNIASYSIPDRPIATEVVEGIADFIARHPREQGKPVLN
ncbi:MAG: hypothetical protein A4S12_12685 [Proteobacteria bacterium SG_bin5]|nr:alpha/beta fold hydrolase [Sphingomonas sp.]OQW45493.1 MAG: hypothetical protein A4S12_12685 [Proteobacteria bacterium SG_bin5]